MEKGSSISRVLTLAAAALAVVLSYGSAGLAQSASQASVDRAREAQIEHLKAKIDKLQVQLKKVESEQTGGAAAMPPQGNQAGQMAQTGAGEPSPGAEHPMGEGMGGGGMGGGGMGGGGMMGGASPQASPGGMPMQEHMKGMGHMHGMMHGEGAGANPAASPGGMPMEHGMGEGMGGMGGGGMSGQGTQGGTGGAQPQASPSPGMGGDM
jgi:cell division protein FtsB